MKIFGWALIIISAGWLYLSSFAKSPIHRGIILKHYDLVPEQESFTRHEVIAHIRDVSLELSASGPWLGTTTTSLLIGFWLVLKSKTKTNHNTTTERIPQRGTRSS